MNFFKLTWDETELKILEIVCMRLIDVNPHAPKLSEDVRTFYFELGILVIAIKVLDGPVHSFSHLIQLNCELNLEYLRGYFFLTD